MLKKSLAATAAALSFGFVLPAGAQTQPQTPQDLSSPFTVEESALCAATFEWMIQFLQPGAEQSQEAQQFRMRQELGAMMWGYELYTGMGAPDQAVIEAKLTEGVEALIADFPEEETEAAEQEIVQSVMTQADSCVQKLQAEYPQGNHPVMQQLAAQQQMMQQQQQQGQPQAEQPQGMAPIGE